MDKPDIQLLERFREGDEKAFLHLYNLYRKPVIGFCISLIKDPQLGEHLYHEVLMKIWDRRQHLQPGLNFSYYLFTAVKNRIFDHLKEVKKSEALKKEFLRNMALLQQEEAGDKEQQLQQLEGLVQALSPQRRRILELNFVLGKSYEEIAHQLLISKNTVRNHLVKIKLLLRKGIV
ncbi:MAG: RNA polymerase sigma factor [Adhaeribacter sp.]